MLSSGGGFAILFHTEANIDRQQWHVEWNLLPKCEIGAHTQNGWPASFSFCTVSQNSTEMNWFFDKVKKNIYI